MSKPVLHVAIGDENDCDYCCGEGTVIVADDDAYCPCCGQIYENPVETEEICPECEGSGVKRKDKS